MIYATSRERLVLAALGGLAVLGLSMLLWQQQHPPVLVEMDASAPASAPWDAALRESRQVDLNAATSEDLERLPNVGPSLAQKILEYRRTLGRFRRTDELLQVPGIGPKTYDALKDTVTVR